MSFRERTSQAPGWDVDDDGGPPVWQDRAVPDRSSKVYEPLVTDLPAWSTASTGDDEHLEDPSPAPPQSPPARRTPGLTSDRRGTPWPSLRDSLKGGSATSASSSRTGRRAVPYPSSAPNHAESETAFDGERFGDDRTWSDHGEFPPTEPDILAYEETRYPVRRAATTRTRQRSRRAVAPASRSSLHMPAALVTLAATQDRFVLGAAGLSCLSLLMMAATVSSRSDALPSWIVTHLDAAGNPDHWGTTATVWRVPLMTAMVTLGNVIGAMFVSRRDAFAARFLLAAALLVHALAWIGLVRILW